ncbi:helix-turn-helix domain-containing protein [Pantanalinema rosaneae CENA516]
MPAFRDAHDTLDALCKHLKCQVSDLLQYEPDPEEPTSPQ